MNVNWSPSPNFTKSRRIPIAIVDHITAGGFPGCLSWMQNPKAQASAHYLVTRDGAIYQMVRDEDIAWHAGIVNGPNWTLYDGTNPNHYTLGIEHECIEGGDLTEEQYRATLWLHQMLCTKWNIPMDFEHIIGHCRLDTVNRIGDPGPDFPWERLFNDLKGGDTMEPWKLQLIADAKEAGLIKEDHNPDEPATKWFVLAIALRILARIGGIR